MWLWLVIWSLLRTAASLLPAAALAPLVTGYCSAAVVALCWLTRTASCRCDNTVHWPLCTAALLPAVSWSWQLLARQPRPPPCTGCIILSRTQEPRISAQYTKGKMGDFLLFTRLLENMFKVQTWLSIRRASFYKESLCFCCCDINRYISLDWFSPLPFHSYVSPLPDLLYCGCWLYVHMLPGEGGELGNIRQEYNYLQT